MLSARVDGWEVRHHIEPGIHYLRVCVCVSTPVLGQINSILKITRPDSSSESQERNPEMFNSLILEDFLQVMCSRASLRKNLPPSKSWRKKTLGPHDSMPSRQLAHSRVRLFDKRAGAFLGWLLGWGAQLQNSHSHPGGGAMESKRKSQWSQIWGLFCHFSVKAWNWLLFRNWNIDDFSVE